MKVILITGATSGIGFETAKFLTKQGHIVYGAGRQEEKLKRLKAAGIKPINLDVTSEESTKIAVESILKKEGKIDILINNAGYGSYGAIEDVSLQEAQKQFDVNLFGVARLTQ